MTDGSTAPAPTSLEPRQRAVLRRLFLTLFLRGRGARGLRKESAPRSVGSKLALTLAFCGLFGAMAFSFVRQPVFALSIYLHAMTFACLGMFVTGSAGEMLFSRDEADILLHRPVSPRTLLQAKVRVLVEVSLWIAGAFNLVGFAVGVLTPDGGWRFPLAHAVSTTLEALFCTGCVVVAYQLCLRFCGRERLEGLMTSAQVAVSVGAVLAAQLLPRLLDRPDLPGASSILSWWLFLLPPTWFAGFDDVLCGHGGLASWLLTGCALLGAAGILTIAFGRLARDYETGLQALNETATSRRPRAQPGRRWMDFLVGAPPLRWWLRDRVERTAFTLCAAYLVRDRDMKLRVYPLIAPMLIMPVVMMMLWPQLGGADDVGIVFAGVSLCILPVVALQQLQYSQHWQAADLFRAVPIAGPGRLCQGARRAVFSFLVVPLVAVFATAVLFLCRDPRVLLLLLPGLLASPLFLHLATLRGKAVPLSHAAGSPRAAGRGIAMIGLMLVAGWHGGLAPWAWSSGWFGWLILAEAVAVMLLNHALGRALVQTPWSSLE